MRPLAPRLRLFFLTLTSGMAAALVPVAAPLAQQWTDVATISSTLGNNAERLCVGGGRTDLGCPVYAPYVSASTGRVGLGNTTPSSTLHVAGPNNSGSGGLTIGTNDASNGRRMDIYASGSASTTFRNYANGSTVFGNGAGTPLLKLSHDFNVVGIGGAPALNLPSTTLHIGGSLRIGAETSSTMMVCDADRTGAIKYESNTFYICQNAVNGWEALATTGANSLADRITSNSQAGVIANQTGYVSFTTGGVTGTVYFNPAGVLVNRGISTTSTVSATRLYLTNASVTYYTNLLVAPSSADGFSLMADTTNSTFAAPYNHLNIGTSRGDAASTDDIRFFSSDANGSRYNMVMKGDSGNIGIGTTAPNASLTVVLAGPGAAFAISRTSQGEINTAINNNHIVTLVRNGVGTQVAAQRIDLTTGNFGVNAGFNPSATLHVGGTGMFNGNVTVGSNITASSTLHVVGVSTTAGGITVGTPLNRHGVIYPFGSGSLGMEAFGNASVVLRTNNATVASFNSSGTYFGGSGTPSTSLHVSGTLRIAARAEACDADRLGAIKYMNSNFYVCQTALNGWEPLSTSTSSTTPSISSGLSGSIVFRDEYGYLKANNTFSISSTTGSVGIGAGAPTYIGNNGLYASGNLYAAGGTIGNVFAGTSLFSFGDASSYISGNSTTGQDFIAMVTSGTEAFRIVSTGFVGIGTSTPSSTFDVMGRATLGKTGLNIPLMFRRPTDGSAVTYFGFGEGSGSSTSDFGLTHSTGGGTMSFSLNNNGPVAPFMRISGYDGATQVPGVIIGTSITYPSTTLHVSGTVLTTSWTGINFSSAANVKPTAPLEVSGTISATALRINGQLISSQGASTFASLTDVSYSVPSANIFGPGSLNGAVANNGVVQTTAFGLSSFGSASTNSGVANTAFGAYTLQYNTTGGWNTAVGRSALNKNTSGQNNVAIGRSAMFNNTTGNNNTAVGNVALSSNTTASSNNAFGEAAMTNATTGGNNVAFGNNTLWGLTTGTNNVAVGNNALTNTNSPYNVAVGNVALRYTTGSDNVGIGYASGVGDVGGTSNYTGNTMLGNYTGYVLTTGSSNTLIGYNSGAGITTGSQNLLIGYNLSPYSNTGSNQLNIANAIWGDIGSRSGNVNKIGINVTSPTANLEVSGTISGTRFVGDGSGLTGVIAAGSDRIVSGTTSVIANDGGNIDFKSNGTLTGYYTPAGIMTAVGVSTTGQVSATLGYVSSLIVGTPGAFQPNSLFNLRSGTADWMFDYSGNYFRMTAGNGDAVGLKFNASDLTDQLVLNTTGRVGMGTSATTNGMLTIQQQADTNTNGLTVVNTNNASGRLWVESGANNSNIVLSRGTSTTLAAGLRNNSMEGFLTVNALSSHTPNVNLLVSGTARVTSWTVLNSTVTATAPLEVYGIISATGIAINGVALTGASTFASLTDVSYSLAAKNVFGPGSLTGATSSVTESTAFGSSALSSASNSGYQNSAFGHGALLNNTAGYGNTAIGRSALPANTSGYHNVAVGSGALNNNQTGNMNAVVGSYAFQLSTASFNAGVGNGIFLNNVSGTNNAALGYAAGMYNSTGSINTAIGGSAMRYNGVGSGVVAVGYQAGQGISNTTFYGNSTLIGAYAGTGLTTGSSNTLVGFNAGAGITTGANNLVLGALTTPYSNTGSNQLNIANAIWGDFGSGTGNANKIGINIASPTAALAVSGTISGTVIETPILQLAGVSGSAGVSLSVDTSGDNLGDHTATQDLAMATFNIGGAGTITAASTIKTAAALQSGNTDTTCAGAGDYGKMRFDVTSKKMYLCRP